MGFEFCQRFSSCNIGCQRCCWKVVCNIVCWGIFLFCFVFFNRRPASQFALPTWPVVKLSVLLLGFAPWVVVPAVEVVRVVWKSGGIPAGSACVVIGLPDKFWGSCLLQAGWTCGIGFVSVACFLLFQCVLSTCPVLACVLSLLWRVLTAVYVGQLQPWVLPGRPVGLSVVGPSVGRGSLQFFLRCVWNTKRIILFWKGEKREENYIREGFLHKQAPPLNYL